MDEKNRLAIEVDHEDHIFVESVCSQGHYTFYTFFKHLLSLYRRSLNEPMNCMDRNIQAPTQNEAPAIDEKRPRAKKNI